jgi:hypothetical protein
MGTHSKIFTAPAREHNKSMIRKYRPLRKIGRLLERFSDERIEPSISRKSDKSPKIVGEVTEGNTDPVISEDHGFYSKKSLEISTKTNIRSFRILDENTKRSPHI